MEKLNEIMEKYNAKELTAEEANKKLKEYGLSVTPRTEEELAAKKQREDEEGFFDPAERGMTPKHKITLEKPDMSRRKELANDSEYQWTKQGKFEVFYDADGYATKAVRQ